MARENDTESGRDLASDLLSRGKSPAVIGAAIGAAAAAGLAMKRLSPPSSRTENISDDEQEDGAEPPDPDRTEESEEQRGGAAAPRGGRRDPTTLREHLLDGLFEHLTQDEYFDIAMMDRVERLIETREELERYVEILLEKIGSENFVSGDTFNRVERLLRTLGRAGSSAAAGRT